MIRATTYKLEKQLFLTAPVGLLAVIAIAVLAILGAITGKSEVARTQDVLEQFMTEGEDALDELRTALAKIEETGKAPNPYIARPMSIGIPATLPAAPLGDFASGAGDLYPTTAMVDGWASQANLFDEYEFDNPTSLSLGSFDLTFLAVALMPLLMIAVSFDVLSSDRERGRARLVALQAGHVGQSVWQRLLIRNVWPWAAFSIVALLAALIAPTGSDMSARLVRFGAWLTIALLYAGFWFGLIALAAAAIKRSETVASALFAVWATFLFAVPAIGGALAEGLYPPPSRLAFLSEMRQGEVEAVRETAALTAGFLADHPEMSVSDEAVPSYYSRAYLANIEGAKRTTPVLNAFTTSRQKRADLVGQLQFLSPVMIADRALTAVAGGDANRALRYQAQARSALTDLHARIGPAVLAKQRLSLDEFDAIPRFAFQDRGPGEILADHAAPLGFLVLLGSACAFGARRRLAAPLERLL